MYITPISQKTNYNKPYFEAKLDEESINNFIKYAKEQNPYSKQNLSKKGKNKIYTQEDIWGRVHIALQKFANKLNEHITISAHYSKSPEGDIYDVLQATYAKTNRSTDIAPLTVLSNGKSRPISPYKLIETIEKTSSWDIEEKCLGKFEAQRLRRWKQFGFS